MVRPSRQWPCKGQTVSGHKLILTGSRVLANVLSVRCKCMAEYKNVSDRYYNYDPIGWVKTIEQAVEMYYQHVAESESKNE